MGAAWLMLWRMFSRALGMVSTLVLARILVPADFGLVAMATTFTAAIDALSAFGVLDALVRTPATGQRWFPTAFTLQMVRGALTAAVILAGAQGASYWFAEPRLTDILYLLAALALVGGLENVGIVEYRRTLRFAFEFRLLLVPRLLQFATTLGAAWLLHSYWALLIGITVAGLSRLLMTYLLHPYRPKLSLEHWRDLVGFSTWAWAGSIATLVWERCDAFVLGPAMGTGVLGIYLIAAELGVLPITEFIAPAARALYAGFSVARNQGTDVVELALPVIATLLTLAVPLSIGLSATSGYLVAGLLGPRWETAGPMIATFAWLCCVSPVSWVCSTVMTAQGHLRRNFVAVLAAAVVKVCLLMAVVRVDRIDLAPLAAVVCVAVESLLFLTQLARLGRLQWRRNIPSLLRIMVAAAVTIGALRFSGFAWRPVSLDSFPALGQGMAIACTSVALFLATQALIWRAWGCPAGPERRLVDLADGALKNWRLRTRRRMAETG